MVRDYRDLEVWQLSMDLAEAVYRLTQTFPKTEEYRMTSQLLRAAASVPANIAEGNGRPRWTNAQRPASQSRAK